MLKQRAKKMKCKGDGQEEEQTLRGRGTDSL